MRTIDRRTAIRFLLDCQGLSGARRFVGTKGMLAYIRQVGCIQFDPLDVCGRNAELVLQSRVQGFTPQMLHDALYKARHLVDYWDKNMAIFPIEDWPSFTRTRQAFRAQTESRGGEEVTQARDFVREQIRQRGPLFSAELDLGKQVEWYWAPTTLARATMETLYFEGELIVHRKKGTVRAFDLAHRHIPAELFAAPDPFEEEAAFHAWRVHRRIGAVGLLWNRPSDALLGIGLKNGRRGAAFAALEAQGCIHPVCVEGLDAPCYIQTAALERLEAAVQARAKKKRTEFLAPLDNMLWDRRLIEALFDFTYRWEVYTPAAQRKYGYYVLPVLQGEAIIGRIEVVRDRKAGCLRVLGAWWERSMDPAGVRDCLDRFAAMLGLAGWEGAIGA